MADINIKTDGTITGTVLMVDGKEVTKDENIVGIYLSACAPYKSQYSDTPYKGNVSVGYTAVDSDGKMSRHEYGTCDTEYKGAVGPEMKEEDSVIRYIGSPVDKALSELVDKITTHCSEKKIVCPAKETLYTRSLVSLTDKAIDLGIKLEG